MRHAGAWRVWVIAPVLLWNAASAYSGQTASRRPTVSAEVARALAAGRAQLEAHDLERASASVDAALARDPTSADAHYLLGLVAERRKDLTGAAASFSKAIQYAPLMAEAHDHR